MFKKETDTFSIGSRIGVRAAAVSKFGYQFSPPADVYFAKSLKAPTLSKGRTSHLISFHQKKAYVSRRENRQIGSVSDDFFHRTFDTFAFAVKAKVDREDARTIGRNLSALH